MIVRPTITPSAEDCGWAAGFFEGEGSVRISRPGRRNWGSLLVDLPNTQRDLVMFFANRWGGSVRRCESRGRRRAYWRWRACARMAGAFLKDIERHVRGELYRERVFVGLAYQGWKQPRTAVEDVDEYELAQWWFYSEMRALNRRGTEPSSPRWRR